MYTYVGPTRNNYPGLDRGFNQRYKLDSDLSADSDEGIYLAYKASDIADILNTLTQKYTVAALAGKIRFISGGHCYEDFTFQSQTDNPNGTRYVIDLSNMRGIYEEVVGGVTYAVVEPGASNWLIQQTLHSRYGAALPGGSCYSVCAGGHVAGGGYGLLSRLHGLTVDYLAGVEMVTSDGAGGFSVRSFNPADTYQLNWASRGGGSGHFGAITKYYFEKNKLPPAPENALLITLPVPWSRFFPGDVFDPVEFNTFLQTYYTACKDLAPQAFTLGKFTFRTSPDDVMSIVMQVVYGPSSGHDGDAFGGDTYDAIIDAEQAKQVITDFAAALGLSAPQTSSYRGRTFHLKGHPVSATLALDTIYDLPWIDMTQLLNGSGENQNGKYKSSYIVGNFVQDESTAMADFLTDNSVPPGMDTSQTLIQIDSYGKQINAMDDTGDITGNTPGKTAIAARASVLKTQYQTYWQNDESTTNTAARARETEIVTWFNAGYNNIHAQAQPGLTDNGFPLWAIDDTGKYQGCYFNYPDRQTGVNTGYKNDPGLVYSGDFTELYFGPAVAKKLKAIKAVVDPDNFFCFAQSVPPEL